MDWIIKNRVEVLNVAGSRQSKDPEIYAKVYRILSNVYWNLELKFGDKTTSITGSSPAALAGSVANKPETVGEAVNQLEAELSLTYKTSISSLHEEGLITLNFSLGLYIRKEYGIWTGNKALLDSCQEVSGIDNLHEDDASVVMIREFWKKLMQT